MAENTKIEWTDATWNPITGCKVVSPGCTNCYAMNLAGTRLRNHVSREGLTTQTKAGPVWNGTFRFNAQWLEQPLHYTRPSRVFVCAHGDLFGEGVPDEWIDKVFAVMALCPQHDFQVLTKRPARMRQYLTEAPDRREREKAIEHWREEIGVRFMLDPANHRIDGKGLHFAHGCAEYRLQSIFKCTGAQYGSWPRIQFGGCIPALPLKNVWLGVSVEDQARADERIPELLATPAAVRFISAEPLLEAIDLTAAWHGENALDSECWGQCAWCEKGYTPLHNCQEGKGDPDKWRSGLDWVIVGDESGRKRREVDLDAVRSIRDQCAAAGVAFFLKQLHIGGKKVGLPELDGVRHDAMPVREAR